MRLGTKNWVLTAFLLAALVIPCSAQAEAEAKRIPLKIEGKESLPLRVLARAFSRMYKTPDENGGTVEENIAAFQTYYVYARKDVGGDLDSRTWYEVGFDNRGTVLGWMSSDDVFEWKQTCVCPTPIRRGGIRC